MVSKRSKKFLVGGGLASQWYKRPTPKQLYDYVREKMDTTKREFRFFTMNVSRHDSSHVYTTLINYTKNKLDSINDSLMRINQLLHVSGESKLYIYESLQIIDNQLDFLRRYIQDLIMDNESMMQIETEGARKRRVTSRIPLSALNHEFKARMAQFDKKEHQKRLPVLHDLDFLEHHSVDYKSARERFNTLKKY
jgi:hypothetical protein